MIPNSYYYKVCQKKDNSLFIGISGFEDLTGQEMDFNGEMVKVLFCGNKKNARNFKKSYKVA